jgi:hypothetical protein
MSSKLGINQLKGRVKPARRALVRAELATDLAVHESVEPSKPNAAEQAYQDLLAVTQSLRKRNSLKNVWDALEHLRQMKSQDFSIASVARAIQAMGRVRPKDQSIRNAEGQDFRDLIDKYTSHFGSGREERPRSLSEDLVASIPDHRAAALVQMLLNENTSLQRRLDILKNQFSKLAKVDVGLKEETPRQAHADRSLPSPSGMFTANEISATARFLESVRDNHEDHQLEFDPDSGALLWRGGILELTNAAFFHALQKIVKSRP